MRETLNKTIYMILPAVLVGAALIAAGFGLGRVGGDSGSPDGGGMRQYLVPADVTQEDAGTCWVETRKNGAGHVVCFAPGEPSRYRPYGLDATADGNETWTVR